MIDEKKLKERIEEYFKNFVSEGNRFFDALTANADISKLIDALAEDTKEEIEKCSNCSRRKFYQEGYVEGVNANKWIPCSERLPDEGGEFYPLCIVTLDNGNVCLGVYRHDDKEWYARMSEGEEFYSTRHKVLAWQALPEAYKELKND